MPRLCERPGCSTPADVAYGFDAETQVVWLDAFEQAQGQRAGGLCRRHADAMVVPLGWMLDDRRDPVPRLFNRARMDDLTDGMARPKQRRPRQDKTIELLRSAVLQLTLDELGRDELRATGGVREFGPSDVPAPAPIVDPVEATVEPALEPAGTVERAGHAGPAPAAPEGLELDQSGPMAIVLALVGDETAVIDRPAPGRDATDASDATDATDGEHQQDAQVLPWQPRFDTDDDLKGLLKPRGRLLSRAFRGIAADGA